MSSAPQVPCVRVMFLAYSSLRKTAGTPGKKNAKPQPQWHKRLKP
jgi:hypothetical protein